MSVKLRLISTALENGKEITTLRSQKNDQNSNSGIHSYRRIEFLASGNTSAHDPYLQANVVKVSLHNYLVMNIGGVA